MTADLPRGCPRCWTSTCRADLSVSSRRPWRKIEPAGRTGRELPVSFSRGLRDYAARPREESFIHSAPVNPQLHTYWPTLRKLGNKKKKEQRRSAEMRMEMMWRQWWPCRCGGGKLPVSHRGVKEDTKGGRKKRWSWRARGVCAWARRRRRLWPRLLTWTPGCCCCCWPAGKHRGWSERVSLLTVCVCQCLCSWQSGVQSDFPAAAIRQWRESAR